uniref:uncharacterized protein LOC122584988 n=1 Tax=Erigeron canadensis TaxID=72917 RepID=UPI001CB90452|nr:uncharacterized protein LOC122584988 [Erigeron canadensis]
MTSPPTPPPSLKLRLMCSNGGHIVPRPHDKTLCYIGGETRIVSVDRHTTTLHNLKHILSKTLNPPTTSFSLKYQLPLEDLDSLISLTNDDDLENMFQESERLLSLSKINNSCSSSRIRLFIFPNNPDPVGGSGFESLSKSDDWFVNALNGADTSALFSDTSSSLVNCLLNLDDNDEKIVNCKSVTGNGSGQDVNSVPGSPMMDTTSSFGSGSSNPSIVNLRPIRVKASDVVMGSPVTADPEQSDPFLFYQERSEQKVEQKQVTGFDLASTDLLLSDSTISNQLSRLQVQPSSKYNNQVDPITPNQNTRIQIIQQKQNSPQQNYPCLLSMPSAQIDRQHNPHIHNQQQVQYIQPPQYINHHHPSGAVAPPSYYQQYSPRLPTNQQNFVYYVPTRQPTQAYNFPLQQSPAPTTPNNQAATKAAFPSSAYVATNSGSPKLVRVLSGRHQYQPQYVGYSEINHASQPQYTQDR